MKAKKPKFFVLYKEFNGKMKQYDVLEGLLCSILTSNGNISKKGFYIYDDQWNRIAVRTKEHLHKYITSFFRYCYWAKCEWEFIAIDWPYRDTIDDSHPEKIDVFKQLEPNIPLITDIVWNYIEPKMIKLIRKENDGNK